MQATLAAGIAVVFQTVRKGSTRSCFGLPGGRKYSRRSVPTLYSGHSSLTPCSVAKPFRQVVDFDHGEFGAVRAEVEQDHFRDFLS